MAKCLDQISFFGKTGQFLALTQGQIPQKEEEEEEEEEFIFHIITNNMQCSYYKLI